MHANANAPQSIRMYGRMKPSATIVASGFTAIVLYAARTEAIFDKESRELAASIHTVQRLTPNRIHIPMNVPMNVPTVHRIL